MTDNQHFFVKYLFILENKVWQIFKNFNSWGISMQRRPCVVYLYILLYSDPWIVGMHGSLILNKFDNYQ
jgi:hypothetical protein